MKLTGKCKEEFEKWMRPDIHSEHRYSELITNTFEYLPDSMKFGVYQDYFDSVGLVIEITNNGKELSTFWVDVSYYQIEEEFDTRQEARTKAIEKANELRNEFLNR